MDIYNEKNLEIIQKLNTEEEISCDFIIICISDMICLFLQADKFKNGIFLPQEFLKLPLFTHLNDLWDTFLCSCFFKAKTKKSWRIVILGNSSVH